MSPRITIHINPGENYVEDLRNRLAEYGIQQRELALEIGWDESQMSRLFRERSDTGEKQQPRIDTVVKIEQAIVKLRLRHKRAKKK